MNTGRLFYSFIVFVGITATLLTCQYCKKSKRDYSETKYVCGNLYVEEFYVFKGGVYGGNLISNYLTDSSTFRIYIGTYTDDDQNMFYACNEDSITVSKISRRHSDTFQTISKKVYSISILKKENKFE